MLNKLLADFHALVYEASMQVGSNAPAIADAVIKIAFPKTCSSAEQEGAGEIFRNGVISAVKKLIRRGSPDVTQYDFAEANEQFAVISELKSVAYFVPQIAEYVSIPRLVSNPEHLDDARRFMRQKGEECIAEANRLDRLYEAVMAAREGINVD